MSPSLPPDRRNALVAMFRVLASRWPKLFAATRTGELLPVWSMALERVDTDVLEPAALRFCAESGHKFGPDPAEFARFARAVQAKHFRPPAEDAGHPEHEAPPPITDKHAERIDQLGYWAHRRLGSWALVAEVWALLWQTAPDDDHRASVRAGTVDREIFRDAVTAVQAGRRSMGRGPLADAVGAA